MLLEDAVRRDAESPLTANMPVFERERTSQAASVAGRWPFTGPSAFEGVCRGNRHETDFAISPRMLAAIPVSGALLMTGCTTPGASPAPATVPVAHVCSLMATSFMSNPQSNNPIVSDRTDPNSAHGFTRFRALSGRPQGNPAIGFTSDTYASNEAWLRWKARRRDRRKLGQIDALLAARDVGLIRHVPAPRVIRSMTNANTWACDRL